MTDIDELVAPFERLLADLSPPEVVRSIEAGGDSSALWSGLTESGFLDALVSEEAGGASLTLAQITPLLLALGRNPVALPVADTMVARALIAETGQAAPDGPIALATLTPGLPVAVAHASMAQYVLSDTGNAMMLLPIDDIRSGAVGDIGQLRFGGETGSSLMLSRPVDGLRPIAAVLRATEIAGLGDRILEMTVDYANQRVQFGKPIGKQQAVQQQLAVMAEKVVLARIAAQSGCAGSLPVNAITAAIAKQVTSAAAVEIAEIAHAVHGAIGIAAEHDLALFTRRLHRARLAEGSESYWARLLGHRRLESASQSSLDFVRMLSAHGKAA